MDFPSHPTLDAYTGFLLRKVSAVSFQRFSETTEKYGLHPMHFGMLNVLEADAPIAQHDLARRLGVDPSSMVARMDVLEEKGMVSRQRSSADRRAYEITLTKKGKTTLTKVRAAAGEAHQRTFGVLSEAERTQLHALLLKVSEGIEERS